MEIYNDYNSYDYTRTAINKLSCAADKDYEVFVSNLSYDVTEEELEAHFLTKLPVKRVRIFYSEDGSSTGTGEVVFFSMFDRFQSFLIFGNKTLKGRRMRIRCGGAAVGLKCRGDENQMVEEIGTSSYYQPEYPNERWDVDSKDQDSSFPVISQADKDYEVFVSNLSYDVTEEELEAHFLTKLPVKRVRIFYSEGGSSTGTGEVVFFSMFDRFQSFLIFGNKTLKGRRMRIRCGGAAVGLKCRGDENQMVEEIGTSSYYQPEYPNERWDVDSKDQDSSFPVISQADKDYEVFVSNLSYDVTEEELEAHFLTKLPVKRVRIFYSEGGSSTGTGEVVFFSMFDRFQSFLIFGNKTLKGRRMRIRCGGAAVGLKCRGDENQMVEEIGTSSYYQPEYPNERWDVDSKDQDSSFPVISQADKDYEVFVSNLSYDVTEEELEAHFLTKLPVKRVRIFYSEGGSSTGTGEVVFFSMFDRFQSFLIFGNKTLKGRRMRIICGGAAVGLKCRGDENQMVEEIGTSSYYQPEYPNERWDVDSKDQDSSFPVISQADKDYEVFVSNLSYDVTEEELEAHFLTKLPVKRVRIFYSEGGSSTGTGEVVFFSMFDRFQSFLIFGNKTLKGRRMRIRCGGAAVGLKNKNSISEIIPLGVERFECTQNAAEVRASKQQQIRCGKKKLTSLHHDIIHQLHLRNMYVVV